MWGDCMKRKKKFKWVYKNKKWLFSGIGATIISIFFATYTELKNDMDSKKDLSEKATETSIEVGGDVYGNIYQNSTINNIKEDKNSNNIIMSESKYLEYLQDHVDGDILFSHYGDYDGNGSCEMFALVGKVKTDSIYIEEDFYGKIWYINQDGAREVESTDIEYSMSPYIFTVGGNEFIAFERVYATSDQTYIWGVLDGKPFQPNISGKINGLINVNEYDELEVTHSTYDGCYDKSTGVKTGHSWKKYYLYFNGRTFKEYGGIDITIDDLSRIPKGKQIIKEVHKHLYEINSIFYRSNEVININISKEDDYNNEMIEYKNITLRYIDKKWKIISPDFFEMDHGDGYYLKALIPSFATYPDKFPY